jgi:GT2 family glycosyltransferase
VSGAAAYAVVPTRDRLDLLASCVDSLLATSQVCRVVIVDNGSAEPVDAARWDGRAVVITWPQEPPNISRLWNAGLDWVAADVRHMQQRGGLGWEEWDVLVVNDDVVCPPELVETLSRAMRSTSAVLAFPDQCGGQQQILHAQAAPVDLTQRITGYAYMLRGETGLRLDEDMAWWYSDDDLDWRARLAGGSLLVPGIPVEHRAPNEQTNARPELLAQAGRDRETFIAKWGRAPH